MNESNFISIFSEIKDPRRGNRKIHPLINILFIALAGVLSGLTTFVEIEQFGKSKKELLKKYIDLSNGIPSHDTFGYVFGLIDSKHFAKCFEEWSSSLREVIECDVISLDGKTIRSSYDKPKKKQAIHLMNVWSSENRICLAQMRCDEKSNEVIALENLLSKLNLDKCIITADAMHCHRNTTKQISDCGADYILGLKRNEPRMHEYCVKSFNNPSIEKKQIIKSEKGHGRNETRIIDFIEIDSSEDDIFNDWYNINGFLRIETIKETNKKTSNEVRYYLTSLNDIRKASSSVRKHWQIENNLHWVLDNTFSEDKCRVREKNAGENLAYIRKIAFNIVSKNKTPNMSGKRLMLKALLEEEYLTHLLEIF